MPDASCRSVPDAHLNAVWHNRQVQTAAFNYAKAPVEGNEPLGQLVQTALATAQQLACELVLADYGFEVCLDALEGKAKFEVKDIVEHFEGVLDNIEVATMIEGYFPDWWQDQHFVELVETMLFVSRVLKAGCQLRYPMVGKTLWGKYCEVDIVLPSGKHLIGGRIFLRK